MGAGTTDLGAYLFSADSTGAGRIIASRSTLTVAGDDIDRALMNLLIDSAHDVRSVPARSLLWRSLIPDVRAHKKRLFETGELVLKRRDGTSFSCTTQQLGQSTEFKSVAKAITAAYKDLLNATAVEAAKHGFKEIIGIAAGGGAALPFIQDLMAKSKPKKRINYRFTRQLPSWISSMQDGERIARDFSQLAVAIGAVIAPSTLLIRSTQGARTPTAAEFERDSVALYTESAE
jgi:hypothetical protein